MFLSRRRTFILSLQLHFIFFIMYISVILLFVSLLGPALAQTPPGFEPTVIQQLTVMYNSTVVSPAGMQLSKAGKQNFRYPPPQLHTNYTTATRSQPTIGISGIDTTSSFIFIMLDLDVPSQSADGSRRTLLHAMSTGLKATTARVADSVSTLQSSDTPAAPYIGPSPPMEDPAFGHRYVQLLFAQPANFSVSASQTQAVSSRIGFDMLSFMANAGLAAPVAGNFFVVVGQDEAAAASATAAASVAASGSGGVPASTAQPFEGNAGRVEMGGIWMCLLAGMAVVVV